MCLNIMVFLFLSDILQRDVDQTPKILKILLGEKRRNVSLAAESVPGWEGES